MAVSPVRPFVDLTPQQRRVAVGQFERASQVLVTGNQEYGIQLLLNCCLLDPASLLYRQSLRKAVKAKYKNNLRGSRFAFLTNWRTKARLRRARRTEQWLKVLEHGELALLRNPWDSRVQLNMAEAFDNLELLDQAVWTLEQARQKDAKDGTLNRALARLYEKRGNFTQAMALWEMVRKAFPKDVEAQHKAKDLAASATIAKGKYAEAIEAAGRPPDMAETAEQAAASTQPALSPIEERCARDAAPFQTRIQADPSSVNAYLQLAVIYRRADKLDEARAVLQQGLAPTGNHFDMAIELADLEIEPFRRNLAIAEQKLRKKPGDEKLSKIRARLVKEINSRELNLFRQKADRYPTEMAHRFEVGLRLLRAGQIDEAIRALQSARGDPRYFARALVYLGYCFAHRNNWRLAQRNFEEALQNLPPGDEDLRKEIMFQVATGCAQAGDLAHAVEMGFELANRDFAYRDVGRLLDDWQAKLQRA